jgi:hypothetical protein
MLRRTSQIRSLLRKHYSDQFDKDKLEIRSILFDENNTFKPEYKSKEKLYETLSSLNKDKVSLTTRSPFTGTAK